MTHDPNPTFRPTWSAAPGATVGGVDEAGREPLAGAVVAAVVVLARRRVELAVRIRGEALGWGLGRADVAEIDTLNILNATFLAMQRAVATLAWGPAELLVDGNRAPSFAGFPGAVRAIVGGDLCVPAVSAASILAKVARDEEMRALDGFFPHGFARHKGYSTAEHRAVLSRLAPCPVHRRSFRPVREALQTGALA